MEIKTIWIFQVTNWRDCTHKVTGMVTKREKLKKITEYLLIATQDNAKRNLSPNGFCRTS